VRPTGELYHEATEFTEFTEFTTEQRS
jgi:hypothetical protein